jgi:hypothetical protein
VSDDPNEIQRRLELITTARLPPDVELDRESAELRATWLAFGKLLDAAQAGVGRPAQPLWSPPARSRRRWPLIAIAALAATVLLVVTVAWHLRGGTGSTASHSSAEVATHRSAAALPLAVSVAQPKPVAWRTASLQWSDSLDQQIDLAGRAMVQIRDDQEDQMASATGPGLIQYELETIRKGIDAGPFE